MADRAVPAGSEVTLTRGGVTLRGTATGVGPTVLLLHAGGERRGVWAPVAARLADRGLRTVAFALRGPGDSPGRAGRLGVLADDVTAMIAREPAPVAVAGASLGGLAALAALTDPATRRRVAGLALVDVVPDPDPDRARRYLAGLGIPDFRARFGALTEDIFAQGPALRAAVAGWDRPLLLARAGRGTLADTDVGRLRAVHPGVTVRDVPGAGHLMARDAPAALAALLGEHATGWLAPPAPGR